jgi:ribonuclease P protein component
MPKKNRLSRADLAAIKYPGQSRVHGRFFSLAVALIPGSDKQKVACVVSKKVSPRAVVRNALKRRCREVARAVLKEAHEPAALVFQAKREAAGASFEEIEKDIRGLFERTRRRGTMPKS